MKNPDGISGSLRLFLHSIVENVFTVFPDGFTRPTTNDFRIMSTRRYWLQETIAEIHDRTQISSKRVMNEGGGNVRRGERPSHGSESNIKFIIKKKKTNMVKLKK